MPCRLPMCHQTNLRFYDDIAYDKQYTGLILDGFEGDFCLLVCVVPHWAPLFLCYVNAGSLD